jgi:hypothetical protein
MTRLLQSSFEGYLEIDNRESPGISRAEAAAAGYRGPAPVIAQPASKRLQFVTKKCRHCPRIVVINPDRTRSRGYCPKCDGFVCDACETARVLTGECRPWQRIVDEHMDAAAKGRIIVP